MPDGRRHAGGDLAQQRVGYDNADGAGDDIRIAAGNHHGVFARRSLLRACLEHGAGGQGVGADGDQLMLIHGQPGSESFDQLRAKTAALAVDYHNFHPKFLSAAGRRSSGASLIIRNGAGGCQAAWMKLYYYFNNMYYN